MTRIYSPIIIQIFLIVILAAVSCRESDENGGSEQGSHTETSADSDTDSDTDTDADADTGSNTDADADGDSDADADGDGDGVLTEETLRRACVALKGVGYDGAVSLELNAQLSEPLAALDPMIRFDLQTDLRSIFRQLGKTTVLVTHDLAEAAYFGDRVVLLRDGRIAQQGTIRELLEQPSEPFVEQFVRAQRSHLDGPDGEDP